MCNQCNELLLKNFYLKKTGGEGILERKSN